MLLIYHLSCTHIHSIPCFLTFTTPPATAAAFFSLFDTCSSPHFLLLLHADYLICFTSLSLTHTHSLPISTSDLLHLSFTHSHPPTFHFLVFTTLPTAATYWLSDLLHLSLTYTHTHSLPIATSDLLHLSLTHSHPLNISFPCLHNAACCCHHSASPLFLALAPTRSLLPHPIYFTSLSPSLTHSTPHFLCHHPICFQLQKLAYATKNSLMIIQPEWKKTLAKLVANATNENWKPLLIQMMPHNVVT